MNKDLASILKEKLLTLPFADLVAGMVQTVEDSNPADGDAQAVKNRFPISTDTNWTDACRAGLERELVPDSSRKSIMYFEDYGAQVEGGRNGFINLTSSLRLICWLNRERLVGDEFQTIAGYCMGLAAKRLDIRYKNTGMFTRLLVKPVRFLIQDANLFFRYTYDQTVRQYLLPPFESFGIDFLCTSRVNIGCGVAVDFTGGISCGQTSRFLSTEEGGFFQTEDGQNISIE